MSLRARTMRRLGIIFSALALLVGIAIVLYWHHEHLRRAQLVADRTEGIAAWRRGDYAVAIARLRPYISRVPNDADAEFAYGASRFRFGDSDARLSDARGALLTVLQLRPHDVAARRELLRLYLKSGGYETEALDLADGLLRRDANDALALRAKAMTLERMHKPKEALVFSERANKADPENIDQQLRTYQILEKLGKTPRELLDRARRQQTAHPDDPRFEMLMALTCGNARQAKEANQWLEKAAAHPVNDAQFVGYMVRQFDTLGRFDESRKLLARSAASGDVRILRMLVQRLWQDHQPRDVISRLSHSTSKAAADDDTLLGYKALALLDLGEKVAADTILAELTERADDSRAMAWSAVLRLRLGKIDYSRRTLLELQNAAARSPENPVIRYLLGEAYAHLDESELAISAWRAACELSPSWSTPHAKVALALASTGRYDDAVVEAQRARICAPKEVVPAATYAAVRFVQLEHHPDPAGSKELLAFVEQIQQQVPGEPESLPAYVALLNHNGQHDKAIALLQTAVRHPRRYEQGVLLRLAKISRIEKLGLQNELLGAAGRGGNAPQAVLARALAMHADGKTRQGLAILEAGAKSATTRPAQWQLGICRYREATGDPDAEPDWIALGNRYPTDIDVQTAILHSPALRADRDFIATTIGRLRNLTGPNALGWKIARARWLISSDARQKDSAEAVSILRDVTRASPSLYEPHCLLALAYEHVGNLAAASKEIQTAARLRPDSPTAALQAARLLQMQSQFEAARPYVDKALAMSGLTPLLRVKAADLLAAQGDFKQAADILRDKIGPTDVPSQIKLAGWYVRQNRLADARAIYQRLLGASPPSSDAVLAAACFYAAHDSLQQANKTLNRLDKITLAPGQADFLRAQFAQKLGNAQGAENHFAAATRAAPGNAKYWASDIAMRIGEHRYREAAELADEAMKHVANDPALSALKRIAKGLDSTRDASPNLVPLAAIFAANPTHPAVAELLDAVSDAQAQKLAPAAALEAAMKVVSRYPHYAALQLAAAHWNLEMDHLDTAARIAARAVEQFPADPDAPRIAAKIDRLMGNWRLAVGAARQWHDRTLDNPIEADLFLADADLHLHKATSALRVLSPYLTKTDSDSDHRIALAAIAARAYAAEDRLPEARQLLKPLLDSRQGRLLWLSFAGDRLSTATLCREWINEVVPRISADSSIEQFALASAWYAAAHRFEDRTMYQQAVKILDDLIARPDATTDAINLRGFIAQQLDDPATAEANYRRSLQVNPKQPATLNNLAYLIAMRHGDLAKAKHLVSQALAMSPDNADFRDTLGRIQAKSGDYKAAVGSFRQALSANPDNLHALIGLADALTATGQKNAAATTLGQIDLLLKANPRLPMPLRQELDALRSTLGASIQ